MSADTAFEVGRLFEPINAIANALVPVRREPFINLPGLRGYWPMSTVDFLGNAKDHSAASSDLARSGSPTFGYDGNSFIQCGVGNDFLQGSTSAQDVTGIEAWMDVAVRGLTWGCWVKVDTQPAVLDGLMGIWPGTPQNAYTMYFDSSNRVVCGITTDGITSVAATSPVQAVSQWMFVVGRFTPSAEIAVFTNTTKTANTTSVPASIFNSTGIFEIGRLLGLNTRILHGKIRDAFLCASVLSDSLIEDVRLSSLP